MHDLDPVFADFSHGPDLDRLARELAWTAPGHEAAIEALLVTLLVGALRLTHEAAQDDAPYQGGGAAGLVARFREQIEAHYRTDKSVDAYARSLGVTPKRLRAACMQGAGATPLAMLQDRLILEAKRLVLYSNMTVAEAAYYLGFDDPAYFSRTFAQATGLSPREFRERIYAAK
jgi:AraC family transcriptional activator of pobA